MYRTIPFVPVIPQYGCAIWQTNPILHDSVFPGPPGSPIPPGDAFAIEGDRVAIEDDGFGIGD